METKNRNEKVTHVNKSRSELLSLAYRFESYPKRMVTLKNMTLRQFQQIVKISESDMNEVEQSTEIIAILT